MAWDARGYFYRSRRIGKRVVREYFGRGALAEAAAYFLGELKRKRTADAQRSRTLDAAEARLQELYQWLNQAAAAHLLVAGYYRHDRGPWRKRCHAPRCR